MRLPPFLASRGWLLLLLAPFVLAWTLELRQYGFPLDLLFGGDASNQLGIATHILRGNAPWEDGSMRGEWAFRDWLMYALVALVAKLTFQAPLDVVRFWPIGVMAAGGIAVHGLARALWGREGVALALAGLWMGTQTTMLPTSRYFAAIFTVPLFFWALAAYDGRLRGKLALGLAWGAASLSYLVAFFGATLALGLHLLREGRWRGSLPIWLAGAPVVLALWGPILLVYRMDVKNPSHLYGDAARGWTLEQSLVPLQDLFAHLGSATTAALSLLALLGLVLAWRARRLPSGQVALLVLGVGLVGTYHWLVTLPLVHDHLVYYRWPSVFLRLAQLLLVGHALVAGVEALERVWARRRGGPIPRAGVAVVAALVGLALLGASLQMAYRDISPTARDLARTTTTDRAAVLAAADWMRANVPDDAVVLGTPLDSFAINALTGLDLVVQRRPHANAFVDHDERYAEAVLMLMGDDVALGRTLAAKYEATHAFFSPQVVDFLVAYDPMMTSPAYADAWRAAGIEPEAKRLPYDTVGEGQRFDVIVPAQPRFGAFLTQDWDVVFSAPGKDGTAIVLEYRPG